MSDVNNYVSLMRGQNSGINPKSTTSLLKQELIGHYKNYPLKAWALINGIESNSFATISEEQRMHYDAAVIAVRGYSKPTPTPSNNFVITDKADELERLKRAGWEEVNKSGQTVLLNEG